MEEKLVMVKSASLALKYLKSHPHSDTEETMKHVIKEIESEEKSLKLAGIAAANHVLKHREKNPKATEKQTMQNLTDNINNLLKSIENQEIKNIDEIFG